MIQKIGTDYAVTGLSGGKQKLAECVAGAAGGRLDSYAPTPQITAVDAYGPDAQEPISPQDAFYLKIGESADGTEIHFPPDSSSLAAKKAWIETMKTMPRDQQMMLMGNIVVSQELGANGQLLTEGEMKKNIASITSFQPFCQKMIEGMKRELAGGHPGARAQDILNGWNSALQFFQKYDVK